MNQYQREAAEREPKYRIRVRFASMLAAACSVAVVLWSADVPSRLLSLFQGPEASPFVAEEASSPETLLDADAVPRLPGTAGTDSSVSTRSLYLHLMATEPGRYAGEGTAKIGVSEQNPQTYAAGALLANGARLTAIYADRVILERDGKSMTLYMEGKREGRNSVHSDILAVGSSQEVAVAQPTTRTVLTDYLRPSPVFDGNALVGYQVFPGRISGVFSQMGLQSGDVITGFDGTALVDAEQAMLLFQYIAEGGVALATVSRKNSILTVSLDGALIVADQERSRHVIASQEPPGIP